jgi:nucleoside-diphosphate-sugar epimerase
MTTSGTTLVTGATGFIGGRVVEALHQAGRPFRAGLRSWSSAARVARLGAPLVPCDVLNPDQVAGAMDGVDAIVHCAMGDSEVIVRGTQNVLAAALHAGVRQVIHLSSAEVYGDVSGRIDESAPLAQEGESYALAKIQAEGVCSDYVGRGLAVVVLRPSVVYGPYSSFWSTELAQRLQSGRWRLFERHGQGNCNLVYVDDLVRAMLLLLGRRTVAGGVYNVVGPDALTWNDYFSAYNTALGFAPLGVKSAGGASLVSGALEPVRNMARFVLDTFREPRATLTAHHADER